MEINKIWNENNEVTMREHIDEYSVDLVMTSPPYNNSHDNNDRTNTKANNYRAANAGQYKDSKGNFVGIGSYHKKYDVYLDMKTTDEYCDWIVSIFNQFDRILKHNGVILWNTSYQNENNECACWLSIADVIRKTNFTIVDHIVWKKKTAFPITQKNKLSKLCEDVFVFTRKDEWTSFHSNKEYMSTSRTGQKFYKPINNMVEAENNDEICPYNKATYSTDLCYQLFRIYAPEGGLVYDPFMGSGTTALAAKNMNLNFIGSELSKNQVEWAENRLLYGKGHLNEAPDAKALF